MDLHPLVNSILLVWVSTVVFSVGTLSLESNALPVRMDCVPLRFFIFNNFTMKQYFRGVLADVPFIFHLCSIIVVGLVTKHEFKYVDQSRFLKWVRKKGWKV